MIRFDLKCVGCQACEEICPKQAITLEKTDSGDLYPRIDFLKCIGCNKCDSVCQIYNNSCTNPIFKCLIYNSLDININKYSSSGGFSFEVSRYFIEKLNGVVYGVSLNNLKAKHTRIENVFELKLIQKSKYVKSDVNGTYTQVLNDLINNKMVLFFGLPCEIEALKLFLGNCKNIENLTTVSLLCGGNVSHSIFDIYINELKRKYKFDSIDFRSKKYGSEILCTSLIDNDRENVLRNKDDYYISILGSSFVRTSCHICKFSHKKLVSNIAIGDLMNKERGLGKNIVIVDKKASEIIENLPGEKEYLDCESVNQYVGYRKTKREPDLNMIYKEKINFYSFAQSSLKKAVNKFIYKKYTLKQRICLLTPKFIRKWKKHKTRQ